MTNLPQGWEKFNFDNIFYSPSSKNYQLNTKDYLDKGCIPIIDQSKKFIIGYSNNYEKIFKINNCNNSCIIFGDHTRVLKFIDFDFIVGADGVKILLNKDIERFNTKFLFFQLLYKDIPLLGYRRHFSVLKQNTFIIPPLKEQERIVGILDEGFAKIDESIKILEQDLLNLDELMQSALQKAFNPLKDNAKENYKLPQGWEWKSLSEIAVTSSGGTPSRNKKEYWENGTIKWLKSGELNDGYIGFIEENITQEAIENSSAKIFPKGTLLIAMYGATAGKLGILDLYSATNQAICAFLHKNNKNIKFFEKFLFYFLFFIRDKIIKDSFGGAQPNISQTYIKNLQIPLPPLQEQEQIASHLDELSSHVKNLKQNYQMQIKNLQELKKSLLDKAFQGRL
ncbi:restriction endonuclease subunit S [Campylobacter sp. RKI_CA19_01121]|uniref:restriction endonuclease subunit S n=1 Tax=Campylobacter sp. RKI_CA19_01121 TaxID=2911626 RepID=UPI0021E799C3|nr:restriction endonuclease subunit S [Campylobacter sp. RKI_CA19_01121]MCV3336593.1 restriction endonuclease subunit S [Campylobacter sp. RKI_CA19_01121]